ncbi:MAG: hypothetical protein Q9186_003758 [Xanthomendoza sp. 1 TL-2023]
MPDPDRFGNPSTEQSSTPGKRLPGRQATRQMIEHWDFMYIKYDNSVIYPRQLYRRTLSAALTRITDHINIQGDDAILPGPFVHVNGNMVLQAGHDSRSASTDMTWGILGEAVEVLQDFTGLRPHRPHPLEVTIREGFDGRGLPIGQLRVTLHEDGDDGQGGTRGDVEVE